MAADATAGSDALSFIAWLEILWILLKVRFALKRRGFGPTWERLQSAPVRRSTTWRVSPLVIDHAVAMAGTLLPGRIRCLEQALTSYILLRPYTPDVALRIGVTPHGFKAHAWVEVGGKPLNENTDFLRTLGVFELPT
jgi:hypothetical protein